MSDLANQTPASTYKGLLQVNDYTNGVDGTSKFVQDGEGTDSALSVSTTKVGVGTASPTQELDVNGNVVATTLTTSGAVTAGSVSTSGAVGAGSVDVNGNVVADEYALDQTGASSSAVAIHAPASNELAIRTNSTEAMRIDSSGSVGIGTTSPTQKLTLAETSDGDNVLLHFQARNSSATDLNSYIIYDPDADFLALSANQVLTGIGIDVDGKVGIGTNSPSAPLDVNGVAFFTVPTGGKTIISWGIGDTTSENQPALVLRTNEGNNEDRVKLNSDGDSWFYGGNLGIGTDNPSAPLEVASTTGGVIMPRMTTTQRTAISSPTPGEMVYDTDLNKFYGYTSSGWTALH